MRRPCGKCNVRARAATRGKTGLDPAREKGAAERVKRREGVRPQPGAGGGHRASKSARRRSQSCCPDSPASSQKRQLIFTDRRTLPHSAAQKGGDQESHHGVARCRYRTPPSKPSAAMQAWWLKRFTLDEIREMAGAIWGTEAACPIHAPNDSEHALTTMRMFG